MKVFVNDNLLVTATWVKLMVDPQATVLASRYWKGVVFVAVPPLAGTFGYAELGCVMVIPAVQKRDERSAVDENWAGLHGRGRP